MNKWLHWLSLLHNLTKLQGVFHLALFNNQHYILIANFNMYAAVAIECRFWFRNSVLSE